MNQQEPIKIDFMKEKNPDKLKDLIVILLKENEALKKKFLSLQKPIR